MDFLSACVLAKNLQDAGIKAGVMLAKQAGQSRWCVAVVLDDGSYAYCDSPETAFQTAGIVTSLDNDHKPFDPKAADKAAAKATKATAPNK